MGLRDRPVDKLVVNPELYRCDQLSDGEVSSYQNTAVSLTSQLECEKPDIIVSYVEQPTSITQLPCIFPKQTQQFIPTHCDYQSHNCLIRLPIYPSNDTPPPARLPAPPAHFTRLMRTEPAGYSGQTTPDRSHSAAHGKPGHARRLIR